LGQRLRHSLTSSSAPISRQPQGHLHWRTNGNSTNDNITNGNTTNGNTTNGNSQDGHRGTTPVYMGTGSRRHGTESTRKIPSY
jgi:hypothetical protein